MVNKNFVLGLLALFTISTVPDTRKSWQGKDVGRAYLAFTALQSAGVAADALLSVTQNKQGVNSAGVTSYTISAGKTLRCQSMSICARAGAAAASWSVLNLRHNPAGATTASSPVVATVEAEDPAAVSGEGSCASVTIPDGVEFAAGGGASVGLSHVSSATTNVETVTLVCYEY